MMPADQLLAVALFAFAMSATPGSKGDYQRRQ